MSAAQQWARRAVVGMTALWVVALVVCFALRIGFPLELEWMEGGSLHQALRLQQGLPIYPVPSAEFVPFLYTPLYPALLAALGFVFPLDYPLGRAVSVLAVVAIGVGLWRLVGREGKPRAHQAAAVGLWCAGYVFSFRWYDVARADSLFLALLLWGLLLLRDARGRPRRAALAGLLVALAFWTKQTAAVFVLASGLAALWIAPRQWLWYAGVIALVDGGGVLLGQRLSDGQLWRYIYELHQGHAFNSERFTRKTWGMFLHAAPLLAALLAGLVGAGLRRAALWWRSRRAGPQDMSEGAGLERQVRKDRLQGLAYWGVMAAAGLLVSALGYSTQWAEPNAFMPGVCFGAALVAVALPVGRGEAAALGLVAAQLVFALVLEPRYQPIQDRGFVAGLKDSYVRQKWQRSVPTPGMRAHAGSLRAELAAQTEPVLALQRPWWSVLAGGPGHVGVMGMHDLPRAEQRAIEQALVAEVEAGVPGAVYLEGEVPAWLRPALASRYRLVRKSEGSARVLPLTGYMSVAGMVTPWRGAQWLYVRQGESP